MGVGGGRGRFRQWKRSSWGRPQWDAIRLQLPVAESARSCRRVALARWSRTLSALIAAGVPILQAIEITGKTAGNTVVENAMDEVTSRSSRGGTIAGPAEARRRSSRRWSPTWSASARRPARSTRCSRRSPTSTRTRSPPRSRRLTSILEPVMIIVVGAIVGFIVISMYMPLFKVYDAIK